MKPKRIGGEQGGIVDKEMPLHVSNVALYNPPPTRATAWVSRPWTTDARCAYSSQTAKSLTSEAIAMARLRIITKKRSFPN